MQIYNAASICVIIWVRISGLATAAGVRGEIRNQFSSWVPFGMLYERLARECVTASSYLHTTVLYSNDYFS